MRIDPSKSFRYYLRLQSGNNLLLGHARHLAEGIISYVEDGKIGKANRHLGSLQTLLSITSDISLIDFNECK